MSTRGYRCALVRAGVTAIATALLLTPAAMSAVTINSQRDQFERQIRVPKTIEFDIADDAFGDDVGGGSVDRLGLKFFGVGMAREDTDVQIRSGSLSMLLSGDSLRTINIDLGQPVHAFGALFSDPRLVAGLTITVAGRTVRMADLPDIRDGGPTFAGFVSDQPFHVITFSLPADFRGQNDKALVVDNFVFGSIPSPGAAGLLVGASACLGLRRRR